MKCSDCDGAYVGQTSRCFSTRAKEHARCFRNNSSVSHFSKHLLERNHSSDFIPEILHIGTKGRRLNFLEQLEIRRLTYSSKYTLVNEHLFPSHSPLINSLTITMSLPLYLPNPLTPTFLFLPFFSIFFLIPSPLLTS